MLCPRILFLTRVGFFAFSCTLNSKCMLQIVRLPEVSCCIRYLFQGSQKIANLALHNHQPHHAGIRAFTMFHFAPLGFQIDGASWDGEGILQVQCISCPLPLQSNLSLFAFLVLVFHSWLLRSGLHAGHTQIFGKNLILCCLFRIMRYYWGYVDFS